MLKKSLPIFIPFIGVLAFLLFTFQYSLSTFFLPHIFPYDEKRLMELFLLVSAPLMSLLFYENIISIFQSMRKPTQAVLGLFLLLGFLSSLFAAIPMAALLEWSLFILLIFFSVFWCAVGLKVGPRFFFYNALLVFFAAAFYLVPVIKAYLWSIHHNQAINFFPFFINPRFLAQFIVWALPLLPLILLTKKPWPLKMLFFALASFWWTLAIVNGSRGLLLSLGIASLIGLLIFRKALLPWIFQQLLLIATAIFLIFIFTHSLPLFLKNKTQAPALSATLNNIHNNIVHINTVSSNTLNPRLVLYKNALNLTLQHPLLGVGPMHFALSPSKMMKKYTVFNAHPHNFLLLFLSEWGIPATIALAFFIIILLKNFFKALPKKSGDFVAPSFSIALIAGLFYALFSGVFVMPLSQVMGAIIIGNCLVLYFQNKPAEEIKKAPLPIIVGALLIFSISIVSLNVIPVLPRLTQLETLWFQRHQSDIGEFVPRFWMQGWLIDQPLRTNPE